MAVHINFTLNIFDQTLRNLPPLAPENLVRQFESARREVTSLPPNSRDELEERLIPHAKALWPYSEAWQEWLRKTEKEHGRTYFLSHLPKEASNHFHLFELHGGTVHDLAHGGAAGFFSSELRPIITIALISMAEDIRTHALQALHGVGRAAYDRILLAWQEKFLLIENVLFGLEKQIENLTDHPSLQNEIRAFIRGCEYGLTRLGPPVALEAIHKAKEHFVGRHKEKILQR
jgi:hypothetical protein